MQNVTTKVRRNQGWLQMLWKRRKRSVTVRPCDRWSSRLVEHRVAKAPSCLRDLAATAAANGQCSPHAVGRWRTRLEPVLLTAHADTCLRALGSRVAERPAAEPPLLVTVERVQFCFRRCLHCDSHVKVRLTETERQRDRDRETERQRVRETESQRVRESESQRVRESESQRVRESESQRVRESESQRSQRVREYERVRESTREYERVRESTRERGRETERERDRETERDRERQRETERDREIVRERDRGFGVHCLLRAIPSVLHACVEIASHVLMSEWSDVTSRRQRRHERKVPGMASTIWTACCRLAMRGIQDTVVRQGTRAVDVASKGT